MPAPGFQNPHAVLGRGRLEKLVDLAVLKQGVGSVRPASHPSLNQVVAVDGGGNCDAAAARLHELQNGHLAGNVLMGHPVGTEEQIAFSGVQLAAGGIVEVGEEDLVGQRQWVAQSLPHRLEPKLHLSINLGHEFRRRSDPIHESPFLLCCRWSFANDSIGDAG